MVSPSVVLRRKVAVWPAGTQVDVVGPHGDRVMVEVSDEHGGTLDILVVDRRLLTLAGAA